MAVSVIAGLGNPGPEYRQTRHNVGFQVIDALGEACKADWKSQKKQKALVAKVTFAGRAILLVKPETYMNDSGVALGAVMRYHKLAPESIAAIFDEINLEVGRCKISVRGGPGGHNGVASLLQHVGPGFIRFRVGVGGKPNRTTDLKNWVLGKFNDDEQQLIQSRTPEYLEGLRILVQLGPTAAMNRLNTRIPNPNHEPNRDNQALPRDLHP